MSYLGNIISSCATDNPLTGNASCDRLEGLTDMLILTDVNARYPIDPEAFNEGLQEWINTSGTMRMMPVKNIWNDTVSGGEINTSQVGYGPITPTGLSAASSEFQIGAGLCFYKELSRANKNKYRVFRIDKEGYIYGTVKVVAGESYFVGFEATVFARTTKATDDSTEGGVFLYVSYSANYENEMKNVNAFQVNNIPDGLIGVTLQKGAGAGQVKVISSCAGSDVTSDHQWSADAFVNKNGEAPESAVYSAETGFITIAPSGSYKIQTADKLKTLDITGIEGVNNYVAV